MWSREPPHPDPTSAEQVDRRQPVQERPTLPELVEGRQPIQERAPLPELVDGRQPVQERPTLPELVEGRHPVEGPARPARAPAHVLGLQRAVGNAAVSGLLSRPRSDPGQPLDPGIRRRLEHAYGADLSGVSVRADASEASAAGAAAYTVGSQIVVDPAHHRPGTVAGDTLIAHEVAHTVQQTAPGGTPAPAEALEADADRAAVGVAMDVPSVQGFFPRLRAALSLQRCKGCSDTERSQLEQLRDESDPSRLESQLRPATDSQLSRLEPELPAGSVQADAVAWERSVRAKDFRRVAALNARTDARFRAAYRERIFDLLMGGTLSVRVDGSDPAFVEFVRSSFDELLRLDSGFRLLVELLATGKPVTLRAGVEATTDPVDDEAARAATLPDGRPGGTGSTITLNPATATNSVGLSGRPGQLAIIPLDASITVGHELIHALNNARGQNAAPLVNPAILRGVLGGRGLVLDPVTGEPQSAEELRTITGQTTFTAGGGQPGVPPTQTTVAPTTISENDLRRDAGLPPRSSHFGATGTVVIPLGASRTVDDLTARYRLPGGAVPAAGAAAIRAMLVTQDLERLMPVAAAAGLANITVPHGDHVVLHIRFVVGNAALADSLQGLTVR